jgi:hypothetical protein
MQPLTHHEILRVIEPFIRRGRHVDLPASNRIERRLVFKPVLHEETSACAGALEILQLENPQPKVYTLTRTVTLESGASAKLVTDGENLEHLLARIETIPPQRHFHWVGDIPVARSYRLKPAAGGSGDGKPPLLILTSAEARLHGLALTLKADAVKGYPAEIELSPQPDAPLDLPEDLLATLGWDWRVLRRRGAGWTTSLRAPGREPDRSRRIERALERTVKHLDLTLAEPPRRFHERLVLARWAVVFRRMIPLLTSAVLLAGGLALTFAGVPEESPFRMLLFNFPPLLLIAMFSMRELPRFEFPPLPRPSRASSWRLP